VQDKGECLEMQLYSKNSCKRPLFYHFRRGRTSNLRSEGISELFAAIILFTITLTVSSISLSFIYYRTNVISSSLSQSSYRALLESAAKIKLIDEVPYEKGVKLVLYNPSRIKVVLVIAVVNGKPYNLHSTELSPLNITTVTLEADAPLYVDDLMFITREGVVIEVEK